MKKLVQTITPPLKMYILSKVILLKSEKLFISKASILRRLIGNVSQGKENIASEYKNFSSTYTKLSLS